MRTIWLSLVTFLLASCRTLVDGRPHFTVPLSDLQADAAVVFGAWATHYDKAYDAGETAVKKAWLNNVEHILTRYYNSTATSVALNGLTDLDDTEFRARYLGYRRTPLLRAEENKKQDKPYRYRYVTPKESVDWRTADIVGPIKNQHVNGSKCGCCWSFATAAVAESVNALYTGQMAVLSEQQLIDCDRAAPYYDLGCQGGDFKGGLQYIIDNGGIDLEADYPYLAEDAKCDRRLASRRVVTLDAIEDIPHANETAMEQAVTMHPIAVGVCVGPWIKEWRAYTGGILELPGNCEEPQDHAMAVIGYGHEDNGDAFWLLKNSWGEDWGEDHGFLKLKRGMPGNGHLGIAIEPAYPVKISGNPRFEDGMPTLA